MTPTERLRLVVEELQAKLQLADERIFFLTSELATAQMKLGNLNYRTHP